MYSGRSQRKRYTSLGAFVFDEILQHCSNLSKADKITSPYAGWAGYNCQVDHSKSHFHASEAYSL